MPEIFAQTPDDSSRYWWAAGGVSIPLIGGGIAWLWSKLEKWREDRRKFNIDDEDREQIRQKEVERKAKEEKDKINEIVEVHTKKYEARQDREIQNQAKEIIQLRKEVTRLTRANARYLIRDAQKTARILHLEEAVVNLGGTIREWPKEEDLMDEEPAEDKS